MLDSENFRDLATPVLVYGGTWAYSWLEKLAEIDGSEAMQSHIGRVRVAVSAPARNWS